MSVQQVAAPPSPYKGLAPFEDSSVDALFFFGRERESEIVAANLLAYRLTVLYGASGVGKSSLLGAGVTHRLRRQGEAVVVFDTWSGDPVASLLDEVRARLETPVPDDASGELAGSLGVWTAALGGELYLILDQFDEYFLYHESEDEFARELAEVVTRPGLRINILISIRDDMLARLDRFKALIPNLFSNYLRLDHLDRQAAHAAIVGPVERYNTLVPAEERVTADPELVDAVLDQTISRRVDPGEPVDQDRVEAPYLQLVMQRLWDEERRGDSRTLRLATLERLSGAEQIIRAHLGEALESLSARDRDLAAKLFNHLVTPSGTKIAHGIGDLATYASVSEREVAPVLAALAAERILRPVTTGQPDGSRFEIFHDVLAEPVTAWRSQHEAERELASERRAAKRRHRRMLAVTVASLVAVAAMVGVTIFALDQRHEANVQRTLAIRQAARLGVAKGRLQKAVKSETQARKDLAVALGLEKKARKKAEKSEHVALAAQTKADDNAAEAKENEKEAIASENAARESEKHAQASAQEAKASENDARESEKDAIESEREAGASEERAIRNEKKARKSAKEARAARDRARSAARQAKARALTAEALAALDSNPQSSVDLAIQAANLEPSVRVERTLRQALLAMNMRAVLRDGGGPVVAAGYRLHGKLALVAGQRQARVYKVGTRTRIRAFRSNSEITEADLSPDGRLVAIGSKDGNVRIWNVETGAPIHPGPLVHRGPVTTTTFSYDGKQLVTASEDRTARLWDVSAGREFRSFEHQSSVVGAWLSSDGRHLLTVTQSRVCRLFDLVSGRVERLAPGRGGVISATFSPDGTLVATASGDDTTRVWNVATAEQVYEFGGHVNPVLAVAFDPSSTRLVSTSEDGQARVWDTEAGVLTQVFVPHDNAVVDASFSSDGAWVVSASEDHTARVWGTISGRQDGVMLGHGEPVTTAEFSPDGETVLTGGDDGTARLWSAHTDPLLKLLGRHSGDQAVSKASYSTNGRFAISAGKDGTARIWRRGEAVATLHHKGAVNDAVLVGDTAVTVSEDGSAGIWRAHDGRPLHTLQHGAQIDALAVSKGVGMIATGGRNGSTILWSGDGRLLATLPQGSPVTSADFGRNDTMLVTAGANGTAKTWKVPEGTPLHTLEGHSKAIVQAVFSPEGRYIATASRDATARIWDARTGKPLRVLQGDDAHMALTSLDFDPTGTLLVTTTQGGDARIWETPSKKIPREPLRTLQQHHAAADAAFSADGRWLVTAGAPRAHVWNVKTGQRLFLPRGHVGPIRSVAFSPRGWRILSAGSDGTVRTYRCEVCAKLRGLVALGKQRLDRLPPLKKSAPRAG
jgi:WD40 repeat protein